ncbi:hypothetical protein FG379_000060 [Cryptosporidium bovis]|uniref:uncharacterized protein n=1 Tax=Cryptosporidium bovis TaxID=310047 RepID=UPI003519E616|nr:hypothetical protein FG379_000060 [Cryptosporidium bovis]
MFILNQKYNNVQSINDGLNKSNYFLSKKLKLTFDNKDIRNRKCCNTALGSNNNSNNPQKCSYLYNNNNNFPLLIGGCSNDYSKEKQILIEESENKMNRVMHQQCQYVPNRNNYIDNSLNNVKNNNNNDNNYINISKQSDTASNNQSESKKKRSRVIYCHVCCQYKPRSTRARFQVCQHIACYDCVRLALIIQQKYGLKAHCPFCKVELDWNKVKPFIVLFRQKSDDNNHDVNIKNNSGNNYSDNNNNNCNNFSTLNENETISNDLIVQAFEYSGISKEKILTNFFSFNIQNHQMLFELGSKINNDVKYLNWNTNIDYTNDCYNTSQQFGFEYNSNNTNNNNNDMFMNINLSDNISHNLSPAPSNSKIYPINNSMSTNYSLLKQNSKDFNENSSFCKIINNNTTISMMENHLLNGHKALQYNIVNQYCSSNTVSNNSLKSNCLDSKVSCLLKSNLNIFNQSYDEANNNINNENGDNDLKNNSIDCINRGFACGLFNPSIPTDGGIVIMTNNCNIDNVKMENQSEVQSTSCSSSSSILSSSSSSIGFCCSNDYSNYLMHTSDDFSTLSSSLSSLSSLSSSISNIGLNNHEKINSYTTSDKLVGIDAYGISDNGEENQIGDWVMTSTPYLSMRDILSDWRTTTFMLDNGNRSDMVLCSM